MSEKDLLKMQRQVRNWSRFCVIFLIVLAAAAVFSVLCFLHIQRSHTFSTGQWRDAPDSRLRIVDDMLNRYSLTGASESEVLALLGDEDSETASFKGDPTYYDPDSTLVYYLGVDFMDAVWLVISLNNGIVCSYGFGLT